MPRSIRGLLIAHAAFGVRTSGRRGAGPCRANRLLQIVFGILAVSAIDDHPRRVLVRRIEGLGDNGHLVLPLVALRAVRAVVDLAPVQALLLGARLRAGHRVVRAFHAVGEGQPIGGLRVQVDDARQDLVALALLIAVLAGERPLVPLLLLLGIAIRVDGDVHDCGHSLVVVRSVQLARDELNARWAVTFKKKLHADRSILQARVILHHTRIHGRKDSQSQNQSQS